jgi:hypothetical protein
MLNDGADGAERREQLRRVRDRELEAMAQEAKETADAAKKIAYEARNAYMTHEAVCAERYKGLRDDMKGQKEDLRAILKVGIGILISAAGAAVFMLASLALK